MITYQQIKEIEQQMKELTLEEKRQLLRELCKRDLFFLGEKILRNIDSEPVPLDEEYHGGVSDWLMNNKREDGKLLKRRMLMAPRGTLKSTVANRNYVVWRIINNCNITILINSATLDNSKKKIRAIQEVFEKNELFRWLFPELIPASFNARWTQTEFCVPRTATDPEFTVEVQSVEGELTSRHYDLILDDDVVGKENSSTSEQIKKVIDYYTQSLQLLKKPHGERLVIGTLWDFGDLHNHILENLADQYDILVRSIYKNDRYERRGNRYKWVSYGAKEPIYPAMQSMDEIEEMKKEIIADPLKGMSTWMAQYELKIVDEKTAVFPRSLSSSPGFWFTDEELYEKSLAFSLSLDPAVSEDAQADDSVFIVRALDEDDVWYIIDVFGAQGMREEQIVDMYISMLTRYPIDMASIETISFQRNLKYAIETACKREGIFFPFMPMPAAHNNANKKTSDLKIRGLSAPYNKNKIRFRRGCKHTEKLLDQMWRFPKTKHDDYPDSLSQHLHMPIVPSNVWLTKEIQAEESPLDRYGRRRETTASRSTLL